MNLNDVVEIRFFGLKNKRFAAFIHARETSIYNLKTEFYGKYYTIESFKTMYRKSGEELNLTTEGGKK